jgi:forkhead transcription factor HCM1
VSPTKSLHLPFPSAPLAKDWLSQSPVIPPPSTAEFSTDSLLKKQMPPLHQQQHELKPAVEPFPIFAHQLQYDKENVFTADMLGQNALYMQKPVPKRKASGMSSAMPLGERGSKKQKKVSSQQDLPSGPIVLPDPSSLPLVEDDGNKPSYSYSQLIAMAILRAPNRRLTLAQIYKWISDSYNFYRRSPDGGWQNSVRHNLSLNKAFTKQERPKDDPGKGHYWSIQTGHEGQFLKEKTKPGSHNIGFTAAVPKRSTTSHSHSISTHQIITKNVDSSKFPDEEELSSDATIPASDPAIHEGIHADENMMPPPAKFLPSSPPHPSLNSSPPQLSAPIRDGTPLAMARFAVPSSRPNGGRKRKLSLVQSGLGDSGYYSSIESSAIRNPRPFLTSEIDTEHPINKRGRAEEELARIRSSSYDSPSKTRSNPSVLVSSSPFRPNGTAAFAHAPATPGIIFKKPFKPPHSVSPNTNLRNHRKNIQRLLGSPDKSLGVMESPFVLYDMPQYELFEMAATHQFTEALLESPTRPKTALSPERRGAKRPRLERANTTAGILAGITGAGLNSRVANLKNPPQLSPGKLRSPLHFGPSPVKRGTNSPPKQGLIEDLVPSLFDSPKFLHQTLFEATSTSLKQSAESDIEDDSFFYALNLPSDDSEGVDILQGFTRIGEAAVQQNKSPTAGLTEVDGLGSLLMPEQYLLAHQSPSRPPRNGGGNNGRPNLGRSSTSMF